MKLHALSSILVAAILLKSAPSLATTARCSEPPGPRGEVHCIRDDMALCEATGRDCVSRCLDRPQGGLRAEQEVILEAILGRPPSPEDLARFQEQFAAGRVRRGDSVFTFALGAGGREDREDGGREDRAIEPSPLTRGISLIQGFWAVVVLTGFILLVIDIRLRWKHARKHQVGEQVDRTNAIAQDAIIAPRAASVEPEKDERLSDFTHQDNDDQRHRIVDAREVLVNWLNDAYAMEKGCIEILENHAEDFRSVSDTHYTKYAQHLEQTRAHADRVRECVERLGGSISHMKTAMVSISGFFEEFSSGPVSDELVKNILFDYSAERFQIASYRALIAVARSLGEIEIVRICEAILREEEDMAHWFESMIPSAVENFVGQTVGNRAQAARSLPTPWSSG